MKMLLRVEAIKQEQVIGESRCPVEAQVPIGLRVIKKPREKRQTIARANNVFSYIDPQFQDFTVQSPRSKKTRILLCRQPYNGICPCFAKSLSDLDEMFGTQAQVVQIARTYRQRLPSDGYTLWVPFLAKSKRLVAGIYFQGEDELPSVKLGEINHRYRDERLLPNGLNWLAIFRPDLVPVS